jgi:hypothetical protein
MQFATLFQAEAPDPGNTTERDAYVAALTLLFTGTLRGSEFGRDYADDMAELAATRALPAELGMPFVEVPRAWLDASLAAAERWIACHDPRR